VLESVHRSRAGHLSGSDQLQPRRAATEGAALPLRPSGFERQRRRSGGRLDPIQVRQGRRPPDPGEDGRRRARLLSLLSFHLRRGGASPDRQRQEAGPAAGARRDCLGARGFGPAGPEFKHLTKGDPMSTTETETMTITREWYDAFQRGEFERWDAIMA